MRHLKPFMARLLQERERPAFDEREASLRLYVPHLRGVRAEVHTQIAPAPRERPGALTQEELTS